MVLINSTNIIIYSWNFQSLGGLSLKEITVVIMTMPSSIDTDTRQELPNGFTYDNAVILSSMVNDGVGWQLSEPNKAFVTGIMNANMIYIYSRNSAYLNSPTKIVLGRY